MKLLLNQGAEIDFVNKNGRTSLMRAASLGFLEVVRVLLEQGSANLFAKDRKGKTALDWARHGRHEDVWLYLNDAMQARIKEVQAQLKLEAEKREVMGIANRNAELSAALVAAMTLTDGTSLEQSAKLVHANDLSRVDFQRALDFQLVEEGTKWWLDMETMSGWTALTKAAAGGDVELAQRLLQLDVEVDYETRRGLTAMTWAAVCGHVEVVATLLTFGADIDNQTKKEGKTALILAAQHGHEPLTSFLMDRVLEYAVKYQARCRRDAKTARTEVERLDLNHRDWLQAYRHSLHLRDHTGHTALEYAMQPEGSPLILQCLRDAEERIVLRQKLLDERRINEAIQRCPLACGHICRADDMRRHLALVCPKRTIKCEDCGDWIKEQAVYDQHMEKQCVKRLVDCPRMYLGCRDRMKQDRVDFHLKFRCQKRLVLCRLECGAKLLFDKRPLHEETECLERMMDCTLQCGAWIAYRKERQHMRECKHRIVLCTLECGKRLMAKDAPHHETFECVNLPKPCPLGCGRTISPPSKMRMHLNCLCPERILHCKRKCGEEGIRAKAMDDHFNVTCPLRPVLCKYGCGRTIPNKDRPFHERYGEQGVCPRRPVRCGHDQMNKWIQVRWGASKEYERATVIYYDAISNHHRVRNHSNGTVVQLLLRDLDFIEDPERTEPYQCGLVPAEERPHHEAEKCPLHPIPCVLGCGQRFPRGVLGDHLPECTRRKVECSQGCLKVMREYQRWDHELNDCPKRAVVCLCGKHVSSKELKAHQASECQMAPIFCPNLCNQRVQRMDMEQHMALKCPMRTILCPFGCYKEIWRGELEKHKEECGLHIITCPLECQVKIARRDVPYHMRSTCHHRLLPCTHKCGRKVMSKDKAGHEATCDKRPELCHMGCGEQVRNEDRTRHEAHECKHRHIACPDGCPIFVRANDADIEEHRKTRCEKRLVPCPHGCSDPVKKEALEMHLTYCQFQILPCGAGSAECQRRLGSWTLPVPGEPSRQHYLVECGKHKETVLAWLARTNNTTLAELIMNRVRLRAASLL